jgi:hypothetical protein
VAQSGLHETKRPFGKSQREEKKDIELSIRMVSNFSKHGIIIAKSSLPPRKFKIAIQSASKFTPPPRQKAKQKKEKEKIKT